jgi:hypothetical protein
VSWDPGIVEPVGGVSTTNLIDVTFLVKSNTSPKGQSTRSWEIVEPKGTVWVQVTERAFYRSPRLPAQHLSSSTHRILLPFPLNKNAPISPRDIMPWAAVRGAAPSAAATHMAQIAAIQLTGGDRSIAVANPFGQCTEWGANDSTYAAAQTAVVTGVTLRGKGWYYGVGVVTTTTETTIVLLYVR